MLHGSEYQAIFDTADITERCRQDLDVIQPRLKSIMTLFLEQYSPQDKSLLNYPMHTYESTLSTAYTDSKNPTYSKKIKSSNIGKRAFVALRQVLRNKIDFRPLILEANGMDKVIRFGLTTSFYSIWQGMKGKNLVSAIGNVSADIKITFTDPIAAKTIMIDQLEETLKHYYEAKKDPIIFIGLEFPIEQDFEEEFLVDGLWNVWQKLQSLRDDIDIFEKRYSKILHIIDLFQNQSDDLSITLYGHDYIIKFDEEIQKRSSGNCLIQKFSVAENGQLIVKGSYEYSGNDKRHNTDESISVLVDGGYHIATSLRPLLGDGQIPWNISKSFKLQDKNNVDILNQAMRDLMSHGIKVQANKYYIGTYDNTSETFIEPMGELKSKLITAALIFAHVGERFVLPGSLEKESYSEEKDTEASDDIGPALEDVFSSNFDLRVIMDTIQAAKLTFSEAIIRDFHLNLTALENKHFVILNGISGTGKTQLCRLYANAVYGLSYEDENPYLKIIPVHPEWTDATALFGYHSALEKRYVVTDFLRILLHALKERDKPHFIVLDEMNLARVEYYFSDYLSAVESGKPVPLHATGPTAGVPDEIVIPPNIYIIGTVNIDETTHSISNKVLDRAFVMTLSDVDFATYWSKKDSKFQSFLAEEFKLLTEIHTKLLPYELHFGYRSMEEMMRKLYANLELPDFQIDRKTALDSVISEKVLPKIRGDERIDDLLKELIQWTSAKLGESSQTIKHLTRMKGELDRYGATQFWR